VTELRYANQVVQDYIEHAWNRAWFASLEQLVADEYVGHYPANRQDVRGRCGLAELVKTYRAAFPDLCITVDAQVGEGESVATRWTARGKHQGPLSAIPPTGRDVTVHGLSLHQLRAGRITWEWTSFDAFAIVRQLWAPVAPQTDVVPAA